MKARTVLRLFAFFLCVCFAYPLGGCTTAREDYFAPLRAPYRAQIEGKLHGVDLCAELVADTAREDGARALTLTFYAPEALVDTTLSQDADGTLCLCAGELALQGAAAQRLLPLLTILPSGGEIRGVSLTEQGHTRIQGADFLLDLLPDGTPYRVQTAVAEVTVVSFEAR